MLIPFLVLCSTCKNLAHEVLYLGAVSGLDYVRMCTFANICATLYFSILKMPFSTKKVMKSVCWCTESKGSKGKFWFCFFFFPQNYECRKQKLNFGFYSVKSVFPEMHE